jgi:hypothetical protein
LSCDTREGDKAHSSNVEGRKRVACDAVSAQTHRCPRCRALLARRDAVRRPDGTLLAICDACTAIFRLDQH